MIPRLIICLSCFQLFIQTANRTFAREVPALAEILGQQRQNAATFIHLEVDFTWTVSATGEFTRSLDAERNEVTRRFAKGDFPPEIRDRINQFVTQGATEQSARQKVLDEIITPQSLQTPRSRSPDRYVVRINDFGAEVQIFLNLSDENPRRADALARGLDSFTGGDFKKLQRVQELKWVGHDPYPGLRHNNPTVWAQSILQVNTLLPPHVDGVGLGLQTYFHSAGLDCDRMEGFVCPMPGGDDATVHRWLVVQPERQNRFVLALIDQLRDSTPDWVAVFECIDGNQLDDISSDVAGKLALQVEGFRASNYSSTRYAAVPELILYFGDYEQVQGAGWYPTHVTRKPLALLTTSEANATGRITDQPFGVREEGNLHVNSVRANSDVAEFSKLALADGTVFLDLDSNISKVIGENPDEAIRRMLELKPQSRRTMWLVVVNCLALLVLLFPRVRGRFSKHQKHQKG